MSSALGSIALHLFSSLFVNDCARRHLVRPVCTHAMSGTDGRIGAQTLPDGCDFDWLAPALELDLSWTTLGVSTRVGFVPSRKLRHAIYKQEVKSGRGGFDFHCLPRAFGSRLISTSIKAF